MNYILLFAIKSAIVLTILLLPGILLMFREKMFRFNRMTILGILLASLIIPLCNISPLSVDEVHAVQNFEQRLIEAGIPVETAFFTEVQTDDSTQFPWFYVVSILYVIGVTVILGIRLHEGLSMGRIIRRGSIWTKNEPEGIRVFCHAQQVAPFSWLRSIVISEQDYRENGREIILHEKAHILYRHSLDILLLTFVEALQWWNPFVYLLGIFLRDIHEYEADDYVLRQGVSCHAYSELIIKKAVGTSSYTFANNFNHSLTKKRITMMMKKNPKSWIRSRVLYVIPVAVFALCAFATPEFQTASEVIEEAVKVSAEPILPEFEDSIDIQAGNELLLYINGANQLMLRTGKDSKSEHIQPVQLMDAIRKTGGDCTLTIHYDESSSMATKTMEMFKSAGRSNGKFKINVVKRRFPYNNSDVKNEGTVRINADGYIWFWNKADDYGAFYDYETLKARFIEVKTSDYVLNINPDKQAPEQVVNNIKEIARVSGIQKLNLINK